MVPLLLGEAARDAGVLLVALDLFLVKPVFIATFGVSTTKEERDLCFLFAGNVTVEAFGESTFLLLIGNTLFMIS
uniref:Uncharacterized protein n=1 Tax=Arundo donax TaxID=35708 RepID=A0A0A9GZN8_ARUDO